VTTAPSPDTPSATARSSLPAGRQQQILAVLEQRGFVLVSELRTQLRVSEVTVRRDLQALAELGLGRRVRGGLVARVPTAPSADVVVHDELMTQARRYVHRADRALQEGDLGLATRAIALVGDLVDELVRQESARLDERSASGAPATPL